MALTPTQRPTREWPLLLLTVALVGFICFPLAQGLLPEGYALSQFAGWDSEFTAMPPRNLVPKPLQKPHPPLWVACTNRDTLKLAARLGMGALTFSFMDAGEARYWVNEYYETFKRECEPLGRTVNPNIAMLAGVMCHEDNATAVARGHEGQQFFK